MKKIILSAVFLGTAYFSHAQVGIGTSEPASSSMLEISATNKGVLIPRVALTSTTSFSTISGTETESLLVYNTATAGTGNTAVMPGFYYWVAQNGAVVAHWERIVNQSQLDDALANITNVQADLAKIINLLKVAFPANNLVDPVVTGDTFGGGMVFTPGANPTIEYVYFDGTNYVKKDITNDIKSLIRGTESKTMLVKTNVANAAMKQYYLSETYIQSVTDASGVVTLPTQATINGWTPGTLPAGVYEIDIVAGVATNFETILDQTTTIETTTPGTYYTVEEYIEYISMNALENGITKIVLDGTGQASFQQWNSTTKTWVPVANTAFKDIVTANETQTTIAKSTDNAAYTQVTSDPKAIDKIVYEYVTENASVKNYIDVTADVQWSIENNANVQNAITNLLNQGGNVYFTKVDIAAGTPAGQLAIPAFSFYTINPSTGVKELIDIAQTIVNAITNATAVQKQAIKNQLGDNFSSTTVVNTGDTWIDGGFIYKGIFNATVTQNTANVSTITLDDMGGTIGDVVGITILNASTNQIINTATTSVSVSGDLLSFKIGTGNMFVVLPEAVGANFSIKVIVEYSVTP